MKRTAAEAVQYSLSQLFGRGYSAGESAASVLSLYGFYAVLGMSREEAVAALREIAQKLERQTPNLPAEPSE